MEKSRAIDLLDNLIGMIEDNQDNDYDTAFRMAIEALKAQLSQEGTTSDLISRQQAIDAINNAFDRETLLTGFVRSIAVRAIRDMPSAQPERKTGRWVGQKGGGYCCSECGRYALDEVDGNFIHVAFESNFCPYCGAKMERRTDE